MYFAPVTQLKTIRHVCTLHLNDLSVSANNKECPAHLHRDDHLSQYGDSCYQFVFNHHDDWYTAEKDCVSKQGHLVDIHSFSELAFIFNNVQVNMPLGSVRFSHQTDRNSIRWIEVYVNVPCYY